MRSRLRPGETVRLQARRHPIAVVWPFTVLLFCVGGLAAAALSQTPAWWYAAGAATAAAALWALCRWLVWRVDIWVVTDRRVIDESGVLTVRMMDSPLETINNVGCEQTLFGRMFGFGRVVLQTAAEHGETTIDGLARPEELRDAIIEMKEERRRSAG
ncbi:MAG TPA: PH domain-containing protein [Candidatus Polarisedimenticolia bacterium]|nr:PH domain-containing protein [Candidatus Polarisedimenticolia bacterium]